MKKMILLAGLVILCAAALSAHGLHVETELDPPFVLVSASYDSHEPLADKPVTVYLRLEERTAFQSGRTDAHGYFVFRPDRAGEWIIIADDELGHREEASLAVGEDFFAESGSLSNPLGPEADESGTPLNESAGRREPSVLGKALFGVGLILALTGIVFWVRARKLMSASGPRER